MFQDSQQMFLLFILIIAPIVGSFLSSVLNLLIDREIPPFLPQINSQSFGQAIVAMVSAVLLSQQIKAGNILVGLFILLGLIFVLLVQTLIEKQQQKHTQEWVSRILEEKLASVTLDSSDKRLLEEIFRSFVDVDYFPDSMPNKLSDYPRKRRRNVLIGFLAHCTLQNKSSVGLNQEDLLVPDQERRRLNTAYIIVTVVSLGLYIASIVLSFSQ